jgi:hypothetical protein
MVLGALAMLVQTMGDLPDVVKWKNHLPPFEPSALEIKKPNSEAGSLDVSAVYYSDRPKKLLSFPAHKLENLLHLLHPFAGSEACQPPQPLKTHSATDSQFAYFPYI